MDMASIAIHGGQTMLVLGEHEGRDLDHFEGTPVTTPVFPAVSV
jgi:hypothetical protein